MNETTVLKKGALGQGHNAGPGQIRGAAHILTHTYAHTHFLTNSATYQMHVLHSCILSHNDRRK